MSQLNDLIGRAAAQNASDIHLTVGLPPVFRIDGALQNDGEAILDEEAVAAMAKELAEAVEKAATILGVKVVVAIRDKGANLVLLHAMDDSYIASVQASQDKAYTAVALKMPTHIALDESRGGSLDGLTNGNGILLLGGGYPLRTDKKIYGGIGVSGGTKEQDTTLAMVADAYFKARFA